MDRRVGPVLLLLLIYAGLTRAYVGVWHDDLSLWARAADQAPLKTRPAVNFGVMLAAHGYPREARQYFLHANAVADLPGVMDWDRRDTHAAMVLNLATLDRLEAALR